MKRRFLEEFGILIHRNIPNQALTSAESRGDKTSELDYGRMPINYTDKKPFPQDGFIALFCKER